jgi:hypothetical protein
LGPTELDGVFLRLIVKGLKGTQVGGAPALSLLYGLWSVEQGEASCVWAKGTREAQRDRLTFYVDQALGDSA